MAAINKRSIDGVNRERAGITFASGRSDRQGAFLCQSNRPDNFVISGGVDPEEALDLLRPYLTAYVGKYPMVVLHNGSRRLVSAVAQAWKQSGGERQSPLWVVDREHPDFEPFCGMSTPQVLNTLRRLAVNMGYTVTPRFERVAKAHIAILEALEIPVSLSGLSYLCGFEDMGQFHNNILTACGQEQGRRIWADLGAGSEDANNQFDLFRGVISRLAGEAEHWGWSGDNSVAGVTPAAAVEQGATLLLSVDHDREELLSSYLASELRSMPRKPFILLLWGLRLGDEDLLNHLCSRPPACRFGIITHNIVDAAGRDTNAYGRLAEAVDRVLLLKHRTAGTASVLSESIGHYDHIRVEESSGTSQGTFQVLPRDRHSDVRTGTENRCRVMPEDIIALQPGQAILFDTTTNDVVYFN